MKTSRTTYVLVGLFFAALALLGWLEYTGVLTESQRLRRQGRVVPALADATESGVRKIEIDHGEGRLVFERRGRHGWQMSGLVDAAADGDAVENLLQNLKALRRSPDAGVLDGDPKAYGLAPPEATLRLWIVSKQGESPSAEPTATLVVGKGAQNHRYLKVEGSEGVEVVDRKLLAAVDRPASEWRDKRLAPLPTFQVSGITVVRPGLKLKARRSPGGQWRLLEPVLQPADGSKIEGTLAALAGLRVIPPSGSFAADDVTDFAPYGLDEPRATIELDSASDPSNPTVLMIGKSPADEPGRVYVRRGDQDDVALVDARFLSEIPVDALGFRSQHVAEVAPPAAYKIEVKTPIGLFALARDPSGWKLTSPQTHKADTFLVESLLGEIDALQTSEYLDPKRVLDAGLEPPLITLKVWQVDLADARNRLVPNDAPPSVELEIGRHDVLKKSVYGRLPGDSYVLALPDSLMKVLPRNSYAYRDRAIPSDAPGEVSRLALVRDGRTTVLEPDAASASPNRWKMLEPVKAPADVPAVTALLAALANLHAEDFAAEARGDGVAFGFDAPILRLTWRKGSGESSAGGLTIGKPVRGAPASHYAALDGFAPVFTLSAQALQPFTAELHETLVQSFPLGEVRRMILRWPRRAAAFRRIDRPTGKPTDWSPEPGTSIEGFDLSLFDTLVEQLSQLHAVRFAQYEGTIPKAAGLAEPRIAVEIGLGPDKPPSVLRIGAATGEGHVLATVGDGRTGSVFLLPAGSWEAMIAADAGKGEPELPDDVLAPPDDR